MHVPLTQVWPPRHWKPAVPQTHTLAHVSHAGGAQVSTRGSVQYPGAAGRASRRESTRPAAHCAGR